MNLKEQIKSDIKDAMRTKESAKRDTLRNITAAIKQIEVDQRIELDDEAVEKILLKYAKQREDAIVQFKEAGRDDLVAKDQAELELVMSYLPKPMSDEELEATLRKIIASLGALSIKEMGAIMGVAKSQIGNKADGSRINQMVKKIFG